MARSRFLSTPCRTLCGSCDSSGCLTVHSLGCWTLLFVRQHAVWINPHLVTGAGNSNSEISPRTVAGTSCHIPGRQTPRPQFRTVRRRCPVPVHSSRPPQLRPPGLPVVSTKRSKGRPPGIGGKFADESSEPNPDPAVLSFMQRENDHCLRYQSTSLWQARSASVPRTCRPC